MKEYIFHIVCIAIDKANYIYINKMHMNIFMH